MTVAGHDFDSFGICRIPKGDGICGQRWLDIRDCTDACHVGQEHIAHLGRLNSQEVEEIREKRRLETEAIDRAFGWNRPPRSEAALEGPTAVEIHVSHRLTFQAGEPVCVACKRQADGLYEVCAGHAVWCGDDYLVAWEADAMPLQQQQPPLVHWNGQSPSYAQYVVPFDPRMTLQQQAPLVPSTLERQQRILEYREALAGGNLASTKRLRSILSKEST